MGVIMPILKNLDIGVFPKNRFFSLELFGLLSFCHIAVMMVLSNCNPIGVERVI